MTDQPDRAWDTLVLGAGAAGLTAGLFLARHGRDVAIVDPLTGNHMMNAAAVENYPGFPNGVSGSDLAAAMQEQAMSAGAELIAETVTGLELDGDERRRFTVRTDGGAHVGKSIIACTGSRLRKLGLEAESRFDGRGVSECATCDGPLFQGRDVAVVGGGDAAFDEALALREHAARVTVIERAPSPTAQAALSERVSASPNIDVRTETEVAELRGDEKLSGLVLRDAGGAESVADVSGAFVFIGLEPNTDYLADLVELDHDRRVPVDASMRTRIPGLFAAGDLRSESSSQFVAAAGDGATAALAAHRDLDGSV